MSISATLKLAIANPAYPGTPGVPSVIYLEPSLDHDPLYKHFANVPVQFTHPVTGPTLLTFEVRDKKFNTNAITGNTIVVYSLSPFGVTQPDGSRYGND
jgi:hypothetical protein